MLNINTLVNLNECRPGNVLEDLEAQAYKWAMRAVRYNQSKAAKLLGVSRGTCRTKLNQYFPGEYIGE